MEKRTLNSIGAASLRDLIKKANELEIKKEHIVQIIEIKSSVYMVYEER